MARPLHALNPTTRFTGRAEDYARFRPTYPDQAATAILEGPGPPESLVGADVGAGTGISARWLADRGIRMVAIEPNAAMRQAAAEHPLVQWSDGSAEATGLEDRSVDVILCAQSFHWFEPEPTLEEFRRILKPGGRLALMWNKGDKSDPLTGAYYEAVNDAADDPSVISAKGAAEPFWQAPGFSNQRELTFGHTQVLDEAGLIGRAMSASYVPRQGPVAARLIERLQAAYRRFGATSRGLVYNTSLFLAERT